MAASQSSNNELREKPDRLNSDARNSPESERGCTVSDPKPVGAKKPLRIEYLQGAQSASFISQRSSSFESSESLQISDDEQAEKSLHLSQTEGETTELEISSMDKCTESVTAAAEPGGGEDAEDSHQWSFTSETLPATLLNPAHQSTPVVNYRSLSTVTEEGSTSITSAGHRGGGENGFSTRDAFMPGDLHTPILGYETMEARSRFTVFKIQVQKREDPNHWFVFRRYSDFLHLNERLKFMFPGFRLALPPKRWFRDNFDKEFLEDRLLGLQAFLNNITGHKDICNSTAVRDFLCVDEPPGPHDSLEESRALCDQLEESVYSLREQLQEKDAELNLLKEEIELYKSQVELLSSRLRDINTSAVKCEGVVSPLSTRHSLAECDRLSPPSPDRLPASTPDPCTRPSNKASAEEIEAKNTDGSRKSTDENPA